MPQYSGNKGEWSEPYVVLKLAADGLLHQADENMQPSAHAFARVLSIEREDLVVQLDDEGGATFCFKDEHGQQHSLYVPEGGSENRAKRLLHSICAVGRNDGSFEIPEMANELRFLGFSQLKNPVPKGQRSIKRDLCLKVQDPNTGVEPTLGFSVKSELGSAPTLLNAGRPTNIVYRIYGINDAQMNAINQIETRKKIQDRAAKIKEVATDIKVVDYQCSTFKDNLQLVDGDLPQMIAEMLLQHYMTHEDRLESVVGAISATPRYIDRSPIFCQVKIKRFLRACALGMIPSEPWSDFDEASGGYVIVLPDGKLIAFYIYNRALFDEYLFKNTKFEHGSTDRHDYMKVYKEDGKYFIKLNLQIRFTR